MLWDQHQQITAQKLRAVISDATMPLVYLTNSPFLAFDQMAKNLQSHQVLLQQNTELNAKVLILQGELQKLQALQTENQKLRALLDSSPTIKHSRLMIAEVMAVQASPFQQEIILNKGTDDEVFVGQAVLDAHGIMGQVIEVSPYTARVLLLTDSRSGIPVQNNRTGLRGIVYGQGGSGVLNWVDVAPNADVKVGDTLASSGLGGRYPVGYPVGIVSHINRFTDDQFLQIQVIPAAQMNSSEQVLLVWPEKKEAS
jgi:rod shape-determining protein MreC